MSTLAFPDPEQMMQPVISWNRDEVRAGLLELAQKVMKEDQSARRGEVRKAWKERSFAFGDQYIWWDKSSNMFLSPQASGMEMPAFMDVYNLYTPHKRSIENLLAQPTLGINFVPNDLQQSNDVTAASYAEKMRARVDQAISIKDRQSESAGLFCTDGRVVAWTRVDGQGKLRVTMHGVLESKVPLYARKIERWSYAALAEEIDRHEAMAQYDEFADEIDANTTGTAETAYERFARLGVISNKRGGDGDALRSVVTEANVWLRPSRWRKTKGLTLKFLQTCPQGVRITVCGGVVVDAVAESMDDCLAVDWPSPGQGAARPSMMHDVVPVQEAFNDFVNHQREQAEYIDPVTYIDADALDSEAVSEQVAGPDNRVALNLKGQQDIRNLVFVAQSNGMSPELSAACTFLMNFAEFVSGDFSALQGEGDPHAETLGGQRLLTNQAKGQLSNAWAALQRLFARVYYFAVRRQAELDSDKESIAISGGSGQDSFRPGAILDGDWGCYASQDSSFPETMADKRASLQNVLTQIGQVDETIPLHPLTMKLIQQYSGLTDIGIVRVKAYDQQMREIEQMLNEPPIPNESDPQYQQVANQAMSQGQQPPPPPMQPSVPIDEVWDYHQFHFDTVQWYLAGDAAHDLVLKGKSDQIQNIKLHGAAHKAVLDKLASQSQPPQQARMGISGAFKDLDPATKVQVLQADGYNPDASAYEADTIQSQQSKAAETANTAAHAQHQSVLAAREAVKPHILPKPPQVSVNNAPDQPVQE